MARRKAASGMTDAELQSTLQELDDLAEQAAEANGWDFDHPDVARVSSEREKYQAEVSRRYEAKTGPKRAAQAAADAQKAEAARTKRVNAAAGRKYNPGPEDLEAVLLEALKGVHRGTADKGPGTVYGIALGGRSRKRQQAVRELAAEGFLTKLTRGLQSLSGAARQVENYGGQTFTITPDGESRLREILAAKGEPYPAEPKPEPEPEPEAPRPAAGTSRTAQAHQIKREKLAEATARSVLAEWSKVRPESVARDWARLLPRVTAYVQAGQLHAAEGSHTFMRELLGREAEGAPEIDPGQFASQAPDGRSVTGLLARAAPSAIRAQRKGFSPRAVMARAAAFLDMAVRTVVADTGRQADQVAMVANKGVRAYVRVVELPACSRCIILAGREYGVSSGFLRHPRCDCTMEPVTRKNRPSPLDPVALVESMSPAQRRKTFGEAGAKAIADGANVSSVVNARKSMAQVEQFGRTVQVTYTGTGSRRKKRPPRLMPEEIYRLAGEDRDHAIRLLYKNGFLR